MAFRYDMRHAYQELATPGMFLLVCASMVILAVPFTMWDPLDLRSTMSTAERIGLSSVVGAFDVMSCYSAGLLALYLARRRSMRQVLLMVQAMELLVGAPCCTALYHTAYTVVHGGDTPPSGLPGLYALCAMNAAWASALVYYVILLRLRHRQRLDSGSGAGAPVPAGAAPPEAAGRPEAPGEPVEHGTQSAEQRRAAAGVTRGAAAKGLFERLPEAVGDDIVYLHVSGHYLDVVTTAGSTLLLTSLADAMAQLGNRGLQVHRSYWVAARHVVELSRKDARTVLVLSGEREVPVSRTFLPAVRALLAGPSRAEAHAQPPADGQEVGPQA